MRTKYILISVIFLCISSSALAIIGPPSAELNGGLFSIGGSFDDYSSNDIYKKTVRGSYAYREHENGELIYEESYAYSFDVEVRDYNVNLYYATFGFGITDQWDVCAKLGVADPKFEYRKFNEGEWSQW